MIKIFGKFREKPGMTKYLSMPAVWALSFGCAVGWGAFVMPGTTFLPAAGPWGTVIGLAIGTLIMSAIGVNYYCLLRRYPGPGGSYIYANKVLGHDHGFICAWMLLLAYIAVAWANATALSLIVRCLFGDIFCFGFSYKIADYTVYMGEVLLSFGLISAATLICISASAWQNGSSSYLRSGCFCSYAPASPLLCSIAEGSRESSLRLHRTARLLCRCSELQF